MDFRQIILFLLLRYSNAALICANCIDPDLAEGFPEILYTTQNSQPRCGDELTYVNCSAYCTTLEVWLGNPKNGTFIGTQRACSELPRLKPDERSPIKYGDVVYVQKSICVFDKCNNGQILHISVTQETWIVGIIIWIMILIFLCLKFYRACWQPMSQSVKRVHCERIQVRIADTSRGDQYEMYSMV